MNTPFPGMDPYLEHPALWQDVHNRLIAAMADAIAPTVAPDYYVGLERRAYLLRPHDIVFVGRPDVSLVGERTTAARTPAAVVAAPVNGVIEVDVPITDEIGEDYLEVHEVRSGRLVTVIEVLSPTNKVNSDGRRQYLDKRVEVLSTRTHLVEIDLLRGGEPMPLAGSHPVSDYSILVSRGDRRPRAQLYAFSVRSEIPSFALPLQPGDVEPRVELNTILHELYARARFDLRLDYGRPAVPPLPDADAAWAATFLKNRG